MAVITIYYDILVFLVSYTVVYLSDYDALHDVLIEFAVSLDMYHHPVYFVAKCLQVILAALCFYSISPRNHPQRRKCLFEITKLGIIDSKEVQWIYSVYVNGDFCQLI